MPVGPPPPLRSLLSPPVTRYFPMSLNSLRQPPSYLTPTFRRIFPFKLKYLGLTSKLGFQTTRNFSTRPFKSRPNSGLKYPRDVGPKATPPLSKSLIEDEDKLSDWVSGLRASSIRSGVFTEDEEGEERGERKKRGKRGRESNFVSDGSSDGEETGFREMGKKGFRDSSNFGGVAKNSPRDGRRFGGEDVRDGVKGKRRQFGMRDGWGGRGGDRGGGRFGRERGYAVREGVKGKEREFETRNGRGGRGSGQGGGGRGRAAFVSEEEEDEFDGFESRNGKGKEKEKSVSGFLDLIGEDEDSEEDVDDDEEVVTRSRSSLFGNEGEKVRTGTSSPDGGDSYLSETRFAFHMLISCLLHLYHLMF